MGKLLKKDGKLAKKNGKLIKTNNPADCPCCGEPEPGVRWVCLFSGGCEECYFDEAPNVPPNNTSKPNCSSLPPHSTVTTYDSEAACKADCPRDVKGWVCGSGGSCFELVFNTPGGILPTYAYATEDECLKNCDTPTADNPLP